MQINVLRKFILVFLDKQGMTENDYSEIPGGPDEIVIGFTEKQSEQRLNNIKTLGNIYGFSAEMDKIGVKKNLSIISFSAKKSNSLKLLNTFPSVKYKTLP